MVFPIESEDRTMRNLLMLCRENSRLLIESFRKTLGLLDSIIKEGSSNSDKPEDIQKIFEEASKNRATLMSELNEVGGILHNRDDFYRLVTCFGDSMDIMNALNIRLALVKTRGWKLNKKGVEGITALSDSTFNAYLKIRDSLTSLGFNSEKVINFAREVDEMEQNLDSLYVKVNLDIVTSDAEFATILVFRDVVGDIEGLMNQAREAADLIRMIVN
ncbi:MAG: DUF47 family protein [Candidatus Bathyarchaeota archaeon]|nr:DUF47 family protein [Candidatus Bathyarchaeota archaeon]